MQVRPILVWSIVVASSAVLGVAGVRFWWVIPVAAAALVINGLLATLEDDLPGGLNNPDGGNPHRYVKTVGWVVRGLGIAGVVTILLLLGLNHLSKAGA